MDRDDLLLALVWKQVNVREEQERSVISRDPPGKASNAWFTTVPFKAMSYNGWIPISLQP